jgi:hypothetical protein
MDLMSERQWKRWDAIGRVNAERLTMSEAARICGISLRQLRRLERGPKLCLIGAIDDATSEVMPGAHFVEQECAAGYLRMLKAIVAELGIPWSIYIDQHGSLRRNDDHWTLAEELRGRQDPTQVGMALEALQIEPIYALSPQAKGRVERMWWTFQDRLVSELRLAGATTASQATAVVERYRLEHNERFAVAPRHRAPAWRPVRPGVDLDRICSFRYEATVRRDNAVRLDDKDDQRRFGGGHFRWPLTPMARNT